MVITLKGYTGKGKFIAFRFGNEDKENRIFIDDIKVELASECPKPMFLEAFEITTTSAKLQWVETGSASEWNLVISTKPLADPELIDPDASKGEFAGSVSANPYSTTTLKANTTYYAYVQAGCGSSAWTDAVEFKTARAVTYPFYEHFDRLNPDQYTNDVNAIPNGWVFDDRMANSEATSYYDKQYSGTTYRPYVTTAQNHETTAYVNASLFLRGASWGTTSTSAYTSIAMLPAMPKAVNTMMVTFWAKAANGNQTLKVGVAKTQTNDLAQGKQLGENITEVGEATILKDEWKQYKVLLTSYTGEGRYITFYMKPGTGTPNVYIDDIVIDDAPDCNAVSTLSATATGIDKATAEWTDASSSKSWVIKVNSTEMDPETTDGDIVAAKTVTAKSYNITGLSMGQTYYIYVSPTCGDAWMSTSVTTLVGLQVPYFNDFTGETTGAVAARGPKNWTLGYTYTDSPGATSTYWPYINTTAWTNAPAGVEKNSLYLYNGTSASYQYPYAIMPELLNANVKDLKMSFYLYTTLTANLGTTADPYYDELKIGVVNSPSDINKTNKFTKITNVATVRAKASKVAQMEVIDFSAYAGSGKYIVFYQAMESPNSNKANHSYIDNLTITLASAPQPVSGVTASELTQTGAKLTWTENGKATKWEVRVFDAAQDDPAAGTPAFNATVTAKEATITGLNASTKYYAYVRSVQGEDFGAWGSTSFRTECGQSALPFTEDWESYATGANTLAETCYEQTTGAQVAGSGSPCASVKYGNCFKLNASSAGAVPMLVFPEFDKPINKLQLTMQASPYLASYAGDGSYTEIGVMESGSNFVKIADFRFTGNTSEWQECFVNFASYTGVGGKIAIRCPYDSVKKTIHICYDNIVIEEIPLCGRITTINVTEIDSVSAKIAWEKGKTENKWNLKVSTTELEDPSAATADVFDGQVSEQTKTLENLDDNTLFYVYVQSVDETLECTGKWSNAKTFKTTCKKQTFPYEEDFESFETGSGKDLGCFIQCGDDANASYVSTKGTNNKALMLRQVTKDHNNYFVFPALAVDSVKRLQLSMQVYVGTTATNTYPFEVGVMTDPTDPSTFVATHNEALKGQSTAYDRAYTFEGYKGDDKGNFGTFIALKPLNYKNASGTEYANNSIYIDNVSIDFIETCVAPTDLKTDSVGTYGALFSWATDERTATHRVRIFDDPSIKPNNAGWIAEKVVNDSVALIEGLNSLTTYYAYVRKECATDDNSKWTSAYQFKTDCPAKREIPYEEGFEGTTEPLADYCWASLMVQKPSGCTTDYSAKASTSAKKDGERGLYLQYTTVPSQAGGSCVGTHRSAAITPVLDVENLNELLLYFDVKSSGTTKAGVKIEAVSDETISADAIYLTTINDITADWQKAYIKLADYYTSVQPYKRLRFTSTTAASVYIDNVVFTKDLNTVLPVEDLKLQMLTESTIKFSFKENTPTVNQWQVAYVAAGGDIADATIKTIDATEYTITGLTSNTSYDIYVRGNVEGSAWVGPLTATTFQAPAPLPLTTGFEDAEDNAMWNLYNVQTVQGDFYPNFWIVGKADSCAGTGENALFITNDSASYKAYDKNFAGGTTATSYIWATRNIKIEAAGTYKFSFKYKVPKCYSSDGLYAQLIPAGATFKAGNATLLSGATRSGSATKNENGCYVVMGKQENVADWTWFKQALDIEEPGIYTLALYWYNPSAGEDEYSTPAAIDSVIVEEYLCTTPKDVEFAERKASEVTLKWFGGKCKNFEYVLSRYAKLGNPALIDVEDKVAYGTLSEGPQVKLADLMPSTNYSFYVRTICPDGETDWVEFDFNTPCVLEALPYTEGFFETPECWILSGASVGTTQVGTGSADAEKWNRLLLNANTGMAILPELAVDLKNVEVEIGLFNTTTNYGAVSLGVVDNTWDPATFKEIAQFQTQTKPSKTGTYTDSQLEVFNKMLNLYKGTGKVLAIKNAAAYNIGIKYITLTELPDCVKPQQVELTFITENAVTVNWIGGVEEAWEIKLNDSIIENVTTNPYRITGLEQGTIYEVAVRALCDPESTSEWSVPTKFTTECGVNPLPMFEDFSSLKASNSRATLTCWANMATDKPIENVFNGTIAPYEPASNVYYTYMWIANYLEKLGDEHQLLFFGSTLLNSGPKYRWMVTPQYAIEGKASLSFDVRHTDNQNCAAKPDGRFFVAISTDNGASWKKADATEITGIDSVYTTKSVSLDKYAGQNIRVAFYMENLGGETRTKGSGLFTLLDNIRMNCVDVYPFADNACQGYDYEGYGFKIKKEDLPMADADSTYYRFAAHTDEGCDSTIALTLTTRKAAEIAPVYATICQGEFYEFGGEKLTKPNPEGKPYFLNGQTQYGCDSTIYLYLTVAPADTTDVPVQVESDKLPYKVDEYFTVPADAPIGVPFDSVLKIVDCDFNRYAVTVSRCKDSVDYAATVCEGSQYEGYGFVVTPDELPAAGQSKLFRHTTLSSLDCDSITRLTLTVLEVKKTALSDAICEDESSYEGYGFTIDKAEWPAAGESKPFDRTLTSAEGCDSIITLTLTVTKADTASFNVVKLNSELPYTVDKYYTIPADAPIGVPFDTIVKADGCAYNRYTVTISQCKDSVGYADKVCEGTQYEGYGFVVKADELPAAGQSKLFSHVDKTSLNCDSMTTLTLTVLEVKKTALADDICESESSYEGNGFSIAKADWPAAGESKPFYRTLTSAEGCDSIITLTLTVIANDTTDIQRTILNNELPYKVDEYYTVPENTPLGPQAPVIVSLGGCAYNRYLITVNQCKLEGDLIEDDVCEGAAYKGEGFDIPAADLPAAGESKLFERHETTAQGCDSLIKLSLTVVKNDTVQVTPITVTVSQLPYTVDAFCTIPEGTPVGSYDVVLPNDDQCSYNQYFITVKENGSGLVEVLDNSIDCIEVYDVLGHRIQTIRQGDERLQLPTGVYMLHTIMKNGQFVNSKVTIK